MENKIRFRFDPNAPGLTWGDISTIEMLQEGVVKVFRLQKLSARFMTDEQGQYIPFARAFDILDNLPKEEMEEVITKFGDAIKEAAIPNASGSSSKLPIEAVTQTSESPDGSES